MDKPSLPIPETLLEAVRAFADPKVAHEYFVRMRWPNGAACPRLRQCRASLSWRQVPPMVLQGLSTAIYREGWHRF